MVQNPREHSTTWRYGVNFQEIIQLLGSLVEETV